jgi:hypothetical protein
VDDENPFRSRSRDIHKGIHQHRNKNTPRPPRCFRQKLKASQEQLLLIIAFYRTHQTNNDRSGDGGRDPKDTSMVLRWDDGSLHFGTRGKVPQGSYGSGKHPAR